MSILYSLRGKLGGNIAEDSITQAANLKLQEKIQTKSFTSTILKTFTKILRNQTQKLIIK